MPRIVKAWACSWGCGRNVLTNRKRMDKHEKTCFRNPETRACMTCKHFSPSKGRDDDFEYAWCEMEFDLKDKLRNNCDKWAKIDA